MYLFPYFGKHNSIKFQKTAKKVIFKTIMQQPEIFSYDWLIDVLQRVSGKFSPGQFPPGEFPPGKLPPGELLPGQVLPR